MKFCSLEDCEDRYSAKGYCVKHYRRWKKHGDPYKVSNPKEVVKSTRRYRNNASTVEIGTVFGYWTTTGSYFRNSTDRNAVFPCVCKCGTVRDVRFRALNLASEDRIISCGCYQVEVTRSRGKYSAEVDTPKYNWLRGLWTQYRLTEEDFHNLLIKQSGLCSICNLQLQDPYIDHCHTSKKIRGLLCHHCNTMLGMAKDDILILQNAISYLKEY